MFTIYMYTDQSESSIPEPCKHTMVLNDLMSNLERDVLICYYALHFDVSQKPVNTYSKKIAVTTVDLTFM